MYASDLILHALGVPPDGTPAKQDGVCLACGKPIHPGDLQATFESKPAFMDDLSLAGRGSTVTCGACTPLFTKTVMSRVSRNVFTADGQVLSISKWADMAAFLRNPPAPPFVAVYSPSVTPIHLGWRAPVTRSRDLLLVQVGPREVRIRPAVLLRAEQAARSLALSLGYEDKKAKSADGTGAALSPFVSADSSFSEFDFSRLRFHTKAGLSLHEIEAENPEPVSLLNRLTLGELWGLTFLLHRS